MNARPTPAARAWLRRLGSGLVSWLCCSSGLGAQPPAAAAPATHERIDVLLRELDRRFAAGDVAGYLAAFEPDHPGCHAMLRMQLERLVAATPQRQRTSTRLTEPRAIGPRLVVRVRHEVTLQGRDGSAPSAAFHADELLAFEDRADGTLVPTFCVDMPVDSKRDPDQARPLRCPPCNYQVGGVAGWLCVPMHSEQAHALEGASLFLLGTDIACDVSVEVESGPQTASAVATELGATLRSLEPSARVHPTEAWLPPAHRDLTQRDATLDGARVEIELPDDAPHAGGGRAQFHVTTFGGLQHLLLLRGSAATLRQHAAAVTALLASYRVLQLDGGAVRAASEALDHHTGGTCDGANYRNERFRVALDGPAGWKPQQRTGGPVFRVVWTSPTGSRLWLTGHRVPTGNAHWTTAAADRWIEQLCEQQGLQQQSLQQQSLQQQRPVPAGTSATVWTAHDDCGAHSRTTELVPKPTTPTSATPKGDTTAARPRLLRAMRFDDLLLIADGHATDEAEFNALKAALTSLRRNP